MAQGSWRRAPGGKRNYNEVKKKMYMKILSSENKLIIVY